MNDKNDADSDSDVSSNSSWTVLDQSSDQNIQIKEKLQDNEDNKAKGTLRTTESFPELEIIENDSSLQEAQPPDVKEKLNVGKNEEKEVKAGNLLNFGCLTLDEYLKERELEFDYEYDTKKACFDETPGKKSKLDKLKRKKCKAESIGTLAIIGTVLAIAGVSFLCLLTPSDYALSGKEIEKLKNNSTEILNTPNISNSGPVCSIFPNSNDKRITVADPEGLVQKCFRKTVSKKILKPTKPFKSLKTLNLMDNSDNKTTLDHPSGPISYEEYLKRNQQHLNEIRKKNQDIRDPKKDNALQVFVRPLTASKADLDISKTKKDEVIRPKTCMVRERKLAKETPVQQQRKVCKPKLMSHNEKPKEIKGILKMTGKKVLIPEKVTPREENISTLSNGKIVCNVVQDLMLLKMTSKLAKRLQKKEGQRAKEMRKTLRLRKQNPNDDNIVESPRGTDKVPQSKKPQKSNATLTLLDQLPFSQRAVGRTRSLHTPGALYAKELNPKPPQPLKSFTADDLKSRKQLTSDIENLKMKQTDFLEKLRNQQAERMEYLKSIRERRQKSIRELVDERMRKVQLQAENSKITNNVKDVSCGRYEVPIPDPCDINERLLALKNKENRIKYNRYQSPLYCFNKNEIPDLIQHCPCNQNKNSICEMEKPKIKVTNNTSTQKTLSVKYIRDFWEKQEHYLDERVAFMKQVKNSVNEVMDNYRKKDKKSKSSLSTTEPILNDLINKVVSVFPEDSESMAITAGTRNLQDSYDEFIKTEKAKNSNNSSWSEKMREKKIKELSKWCDSSEDVSENADPTFFCPKNIEKSSCSANKPENAERFIENVELVPSDMLKLKIPRFLSEKKVVEAYFKSPHSPSSVMKLNITVFPEQKIEELSFSSNNSEKTETCKENVDSASSDTLKSQTLGFLPETKIIEQHFSPNTSEKFETSKNNDLTFVPEQKIEESSFTCNRFEKIAKEQVPSYSDVVKSNIHFGPPEEKIESCSNSNRSENSENFNETVDSSVFQFSAQPCEMVTSRSMNMTRDTIYHCMFGKKGQQISKRDQALWYCSKILKKRQCRETSKHDVGKLTSTKKKIKKEF